MALSEFMDLAQHMQEIVDDGRSVVRLATPDQRVSLMKQFEIRLEKMGQEVPAPQTVTGEPDQPQLMDLHGVKLSLLGNAVGGSANGTRDMGTVAVAIRVAAIAGIVGELSSTAAEVRVGGEDASVDHIRAGTGAITVVASVGGLTPGLGRKAGQAPGGVRLGYKGVDGIDGLLLDILHLGERLDGREGVGVDGGREALELAPEDVVGLGLAELGDGSRQGGIAGRALELDDVLSRDHLTGAGLEDGSALVDGAGGGGSSQGQRQKGQNSRCIKHVGGVGLKRSRPKRLVREEAKIQAGREDGVDILVIGSGIAGRDGHIYLNLVPFLVRRSLEPWCADLPETIETAAWSRRYQDALGKWERYRSLAPMN